MLAKIIYYTDKPTFNEIFTYFTYVGLVMLWLWLRSVRGDEKVGGVASKRGPRGLIAIDRSIDNSGWAWVT